MGPSPEQQHYYITPYASIVLSLYSVSTLQDFSHARDILKIELVIEDINSRFVDLTKDISSRYMIEI